MTKAGLACLILGGGGHAKVVIDALQAARRAGRLAILDADPALAGQAVLGVPVIGGDEKGPQSLAEGFTHFVVAVGGIADNGPRRRLFETALGWGLEPLTVVHPAAVIAASASLDGGTVALAGAIVNAEAQVGRNVILNTGCIVEHDCRVGDHVHLAPGARLLGGCRVDGLAFVGAGAVVRQGTRIGEAAMVGAGSVVLDDVATGARVAGVPARRLP